jgi:hypothetical protein
LRECRFGDTSAQQCRSHWQRRSQPGSVTSNSGR